MNDDARHYWNGFSVADAGGEDPPRNDLNGLLLEIVSSTSEHRSFVDMPILADHAVHLYVIPRSSTRRGRLWRGLNDGAAVFLARSEGSWIRRRLSRPVGWNVRHADLLLG